MRYNCVATDLQLARETIAKLTNHEFESSIPNQYQEELVLASRGISRKALSAFGASQLNTIDPEARFQIEKIKDILRVTSPTLMKSADYAGHDATLTELWCFATDSYEFRAQNVAPVVKSEEGDFVPFSLGEGHGAVACEICSKHTAWTIWVPVDEHNKMPYRKGEGPALRYLLRHPEVGTARCEEHAPKRLVT